MNLYDTSIKNNREMGVLLDYFVKGIESNHSLGPSDDDIALEAAFEELRIILNSSTVEKNSSSSSKRFKFDLLKSSFDISKDFVDEVNLQTGNKHFELIQSESGQLTTICSNYFENVDVELQLTKGFNDFNLKMVWVTRVEIHLKHPEIQREKLYLKLKDQLYELKYKYYKIYWNWHTSSLKIYRDSRYTKQWKDNSRTEQALSLLKCVDMIITDFKKEKLFLKIE